MRIRSMTATFGKLDGETLRLEPGLNVITAPNEWGKSTWCAFLLAMLYGVDTRQRTKNGVLADKEHYKPWSGKPMEGTVELEWEGRPITIQRRSSGRIPMGEFRAFETDTGLPVRELTGANCGQRLLGVERSVFVRSGFLRGGDLPVTPDESFSRRLNLLVTTGDDSGTAASLEGKLRELKNKCQYNRSGLLPKAREELNGYREQLEEQSALNSRIRMLGLRQEQLDQEGRALSSHLDRLEAEEDRKKLALVAQARAAERSAQTHLEHCRETTVGIADRLTLERQLMQLNGLESKLRDLELEAAVAEPRPTAPGPYPEPEEAREDGERLMQGPEGGTAARILTLLAGIALLAGGGALAWFKLFAFGAAAGAVGLAALAVFAVLTARRRRAFALWEQERQEIIEHYGTDDPEQMLQRAKARREAVREYDEQLARWQAETEDRRLRREELQHRRQELPSRTSLREGVDQWEDYESARRALARARAHRVDLESVTAGLKLRELPAEDGIDLDMDATRLAVSRNAEQRSQVRSRLDEARGRASTLPEREQLEQRQEQCAERVAELEKWQAAITTAQELLGQAQRELQSRFAPRITGQAREILGDLTGGRYDRLTLDQDLTLSAGAEGEGTVVPTVWRSDGTADQMYLALRLAVCRVMLPQAPVVLDDALSRFDEERLARALELLSAEGRDRQVILFSCQEREAAWSRTHRK